MKGSPKHPSHKQRRRWLPHAVGAGSPALLVFLGAAAPEFLSDDFKQKLAPYNKWILTLRTAWQNNTRFIITSN